MLGCDVLFLRVAERPDFVALNARTAKVAHDFVVMRHASLAHVGEELHDCVDIDAAQAPCRAHAIPLH
jgi:hypothetical protein